MKWGILTVIHKGGLFAFFVFMPYLFHSFLVDFGVYLGVGIPQIGHTTVAPPTSVPIRICRCLQSTIILISWAPI